MSRSGYSDDDYNQWAAIKWRGMVASATKGKRGQAMFKDLLAAMDAMPVKKLVAYEWVKDGEACALGVLLQAKGLENEIAPFDPEDDAGAEKAAQLLNIASPLAKEIVYMNDEYSWSQETPEARWTRMRTWVASQIKDKP